MSIDDSYAEKNNYRLYQQVLQISGNSIIRKKPTRRTKKSFLGCMHCKRKKIKCDETKPICKNCIKSKLECIWPPRQEKNKVDLNLKYTNDTGFKYSISNKNDLSQSQHYGSPLQFENNHMNSMCIELEDKLFYEKFIEKFVPSIAQPCDRDELTKLFISESSKSPTLLQVFVACGATIISFGNEMLKFTAHKKYLEALDVLLAEMKKGLIKGYENWFFIAIQVMQSISLRNKFIGANASRCVKHLEIANKILTKRQGVLNNEIRSYNKQEQDSQWIGLHSIILDKVFRENYVFNYTLAVFFGDYNSLKQYAPNPFQLFEGYRNITCPVNKSRWYGTRIWKASNIAFETAAKCSWLCRFKLPLSEEDVVDHKIMLMESEKNIQDLEEIESYTTAKENRIDITIAKLATRSSIILLKKFLYFDAMNASHFQSHIDEMIHDIDKPYNQDAILPGFALMIAASAAILQYQKAFLQPCLEKLVVQLNSNMVLQILNYIKGVWELYENGEAFELLFNTEIMNLICN